MLKKSSFFVAFACLLLSMTEALAAPAASSSIGQVAERLITSSDFVTKLMLFVCITLGVIFLILAIGLYKGHRHNPKFVPLDKVVLYAILGLVLMSIPFLSAVFGPTGSVLDVRKEHKTTHRQHDPDKPLSMVNIVDPDAPLE